LETLCGNESDSWWEIAMDLLVQEDELADGMDLAGAQPTFANSFPRRLVAKAMMLPLPSLRLSLLDGLSSGLGIRVASWTTV